MDTATLDYLKNLSNRLKTAPHGQKSTIVESSAKFLNCSVKQVYAMLKQAGLAPQTKKGDRKVRTDKGKTVITEEQAKLIGGMILVATRNNGKRILSVKDATEILNVPLPPRPACRANRSHHTKKFAPKLFVAN